MLSPKDNEAITRVGPGTLMGTFMREYWLPAMLSSELPHPDCDPVRVKMLGEELIGFRDTSGKVGLIQNLCPHRGASLFFGRNEQDGLRCIYHGWKFDVHGACVDMPNEPPESNFKQKIRATAYPTEERGDVIFAYMGSREVPPPLPSVEPIVHPGVTTFTTAAMVPCNWLQALEGNIDTVHAPFLHLGASEPEWFQEGSYTYYQLKQRWARFIAVDTECGTRYGVCRPGPPGYNLWGIGKFNLPCWSNPTVGDLGHGVRIQAWVPMDDTHTMEFRINGVPEGSERPRDVTGTAEAGTLPNTKDWFGRFNTVYSLENDFLIDREEQREFGSFTGMPYGFGTEDSAVQVSMGPVLPREIEHLGTSDMMVIRTRQRLLQAARAFAEHKVPPPGVDNPDWYLERTGQVFIPEGADWLEYTEELRRPFVDRGPADPKHNEDFRASRKRGRRHAVRNPMF